MAKTPVIVGAEYVFGDDKDGTKYLLEAVNDGLCTISWPEFGGGWGRTSGYPVRDLEHYLTLYRTPVMENV